jgi:hypothetical protein
VKELSSWTSRRVIVACALWLLGAPVLAALGLILGGLALAAFSGGQALGFTVKLSNWSWAWLFLPPILLVTAWIWSRRSRVGS